MAAASHLGPVLIHPRPSHSYSSVTFLLVVRGLLDPSEARVPDRGTVVLARSEG